MIKRAKCGALTLLFSFALLTVGCTTTPHGRSVERWQWADVATTAAGLTGSASEANPIGIMVIPIKALLVSRFDDLACAAQQKLERWLNGISAFAVGNNLAVLASASNPLGAGVIAMAGFLGYRHRNPIRCGVQ